MNYVKTGVLFLLDSSNHHISKYYAFLINSMFKFFTRLQVILVHSARYVHILFWLFTV